MTEYNDIMKEVAQSARKCLDLMEEIFQEIQSEGEE